MKVGDLVIRKVKNLPDWNLKPAVKQKQLLGHGLVLSTQMSGRPEHLCATVYYPKTGEIYDIAASLMEVISEGR